MSIRHPAVYSREGIKMLDQFSRTELMFGKEAMDKLSASRVAVFGIGGVGGYTVEALVRSGLGAIDLIDNDRFSLTNINRQIYATHKTLGEFKVDVAKDRIAEINPNVKVTTHRIFFTSETANRLDFSEYDYIVDAIDTVAGKLALVKNANNLGVPIISSMGAGNKVDPTAFEVTDIYKTSVCPLAKVMRYELKRRGIKKLKVVYSKEQPLKPVLDTNSEIYADELNNRRQIPASNAFVPSVAGLIIAGEVIKDLIQYQKT